MPKVSWPVKTHSTLWCVCWCGSGLLLFSLSSVCQTYLPPKHKHTSAELSALFYFSPLKGAGAGGSGVFDDYWPGTGAQWVRDLSRRRMRAIVTNSPPSDNKVRSLNTTRSYLPASAPPQSLCFVCGAMPVMITLICEVLKSSQGPFVYFLRRSQNILWSVCHQDWDAADNSGSARISLWSSCNYCAACVHCLCCGFPLSLLHKHTHFHLYSIYLRITWLHSQRLSGIIPLFGLRTKGRLWRLHRLRVFVSLWAVLVIQMLYSLRIRTSSPCSLLSFMD